MSQYHQEPEEILQRAIAHDRIHSAYLLSGAGDRPNEAALSFARALVCQGDGKKPCEACQPCHRSTQREEILLDGEGKKGPLFRHIGDHPDLYWIERGATDTRVRIGQIRAIQHPLRLRSNEGGRRVLVLANADWMNASAQNALLKLLEEPPAQTTILLVAAHSNALLVTVRSRCQRIKFPAQLEETSESALEIQHRLEEMDWNSVPSILDWAEEFRGERSVVVESLNEFLETAGLWLRDRVCQQVQEGEQIFTAELNAFSTLEKCRKALVQRNANPQMMAERALLSIRETLQS